MSAPSPTLDRPDLSRVKLDRKDRHLLETHSWCVVISRGWPYVQGSVSGEQVYLHRYLMNARKAQRVVHTNGDTLDNRRSNLRVATPSQCGASQAPRAGLSSRYKGVYWNKRERKWKVSIRIAGTKYHLGYFAGEEDAARAYDAAALGAWGSFARLNLTGDGQ